MKVKLIPSFYRTPKPSSTTSVCYLVNQDRKPLSIQTLSYLVPDSKNDSVNHLDSYFGAVADESVDMKASSYISSVKARFRHELPYSD
uniref:Uncharacterized protein n=1 Tax=Chenopodium quinoa TaxID=63459 RepID=A0A803KWQ8_CHEQI